MPVLSSVLTKLPIEVRKQLDARLQDYNYHFPFCGDAARWLQSLGYNISKSAVYRYAHQLKRRAEVTAAAAESARSIAQVAAGDEEVMETALTRILHQSLFTTLVEKGDTMDPQELIRFARALGVTRRTALDAQHARAEAQGRLEDQRRAAKRKLAKVARLAGLSDDALKQISDILAGLDPFDSSAASPRPPAQPETRKTRNLRVPSSPEKPLRNQ